VVRLHSATHAAAPERASKQASLFAQSTNKDITSMNNVQGQAARKAHKAQHCWPPCKKNLTKKTNKHIHIHIKQYFLLKVRYGCSGSIKVIETATGISKSNDTNGTRYLGL